MMLNTDTFQFSNEINLENFQDDSKHRKSFFGKIKEVWNANHEMIDQNTEIMEAMSETEEKFNDLIDNITNPYYRIINETTNFLNSDSDKINDNQLAVDIHTVQTNVQHIRNITNNLETSLKKSDDIVKRLKNTAGFPKDKLESPILITLNSIVTNMTDTLNNFQNDFQNLISTKKDNDDLNTLKSYINNGQNDISSLEDTVQQFFTIIEKLQSDFTSFHKMFYPQYSRNIW